MEGKRGEEEGGEGRQNKFQEKNQSFLFKEIQILFS